MCRGKSNWRDRCVILDMRKSVIMALAFAVWPLSVADARFPRDPEGTSDRVQGGLLRVGLVENAPWVVRESDGQPGGIEGDLVRKLAQELGARPDWHWAGEQGLEQLERFQLDLVLGGMTEQTPWKKTVGLTDSYFEKHVWATAPGENGWIKLLDEFLSRQRAEIATRVAAHEAQ
jgi:polar amino acid transport system substrate-binding protein